MKTNSNKPAYSYCGMDTSSGSAVDGDRFVEEPGLTKREMFAMAAMQALISNSGDWMKKENIAESAVSVADKLLLQLNLPSNK